MVYQRENGELLFMLYVLLGIIIGILLTVTAIVAGICISRTNKIQAAIRLLTKEEGMIIDKETPQQELINSLLKNDKDIKLNDEDL